MNVARITVTPMPAITAYSRTITKENPAAILTMLNLSIRYSDDFKIRKISTKKEAATMPTCRPEMERICDVPVLLKLSLITDGISF